MNRKLEEVYDKLMNLTEGESTTDVVNIYCNTWGNYNQYGADAEQVNGGWKNLKDAVAWWKEMEEKGEEPFVNDIDITETIPFEIGEGTYLPDIAEQIEEYLELNDYDKKCIGAIMEASGEDYDSAKEIFDEGDYIFYDVFEDSDLARAVIDDVGGFKEAVGDNLSYYLDEDDIRSDIYYDERNYYEEEYGDNYKDENGEIDEDALNDDFEDWLDNEMSNIMDDPETYLGDGMSSYFDFDAFGRDLSFDYSFTDYGCIRLY